MTKEQDFEEFIRQRYKITKKGLKSFKKGLVQSIK